MDRSKIKYLISELIDNRLDLATQKQVKEHLKKSPEDMAYYKDQCEIKQCLLIKSYERPPADYFEQLQSTIKKRILARDIISFKERALRYISQPSWAKTAAVTLMLGASLFMNYKFYKMSNNHTASAQHISQAQVFPVTPFAPSQPILQPTVHSAINTQQSPGSIKQWLAQHPSYHGSVRTISTPDGGIRQIFVISPIKVQPTQYADDNYRIFQ